MANQLANQQTIDLLSALDLDKNQISVTPYTGVMERNSPFYNQNIHRMNCLKDEDEFNKRFFTSDGKSFIVNIQDNNYVLKDESGNILHTVANTKVVMEKLNLKTPADFLAGGITPDEQLIYVKSNGDILKTGSDTIIDNVAEFIKNYPVIKAAVTNDNHYFIVWAYDDTIITGMEHSILYSIYDLTDFSNRSSQQITIDFTDYKLGQTVTLSTLTNLYPVVGKPLNDDESFNRTSIFWNFNGLVYAEIDKPLPIANGVWCCVYDTAVYPSLNSTVTAKKLKSENCQLFLYIQHVNNMYGSITLAARMLNDCYTNGNKPITGIRKVTVNNDYIQNSSNSVLDIEIEQFGNVIANYEHLNNYVGPLSAYSFSEVKLADGFYGNLTGSTFYQNGQEDDTTNFFGAILINRGYGRRPNGVVTRGLFRILMQGDKAAECSDTLNDDSIAGISITTDYFSFDIGTLITPWFFVDNGILPYTDENTKLIFRGKDLNYYRISFATGTAADVQLLNDRYFIFNTNEVKNMYDLKNNESYHFASDWNNRPIYGNFMRGSDNSKYFHNKQLNDNVMSVNTGINANYEVSQLPVGSLQQNNIELIGADAPDVFYDESYEIKTVIPPDIRVYETAIVIDGNTYSIPHVITNSPGYTLTQTGHKFTRGIQFYYNNQIRNMWYADGSEAIDIYIGKTASTCIYTTSFLDGNYFKKTELASIPYPQSITSDIYCNPPLLFKLITSLINEYYIELPDNIYKLRTYDTGNMLMLYNYGSGLNAVDNFFCISGQFYCIKNSSIFIANYDENNLVSTMPIINIKNLQFIGTTPSTAYFFSPGAKKIYAFTGSRELFEVQSCTKIKSINTWAYDPISSFLFIATSDFVIAFNEDYSFKINQADVNNLGFTEDGFILYVGPRCYYYTYEEKQINGMDSYKTQINLKTKFYGSGNNRVSVIDCWYLKLYSDSPKSGIVKINTQSLTNISQKSEEIVYRITPDMWDKDTHMYYLRHAPKLQRGMGISLNINSDFDINDLTCSVNEDMTIQLSNETVKTYISGAKI